MDRLQPPMAVPPLHDGMMRDGQKHEKRGSSENEAGDASGERLGWDS
jgi:hypothetical protein